MFSQGSPSATLKDLGITETDLATRYLVGVKTLPCLICSPLREDKHPSLGLNIYGGRVYFQDFATGEKGNIYELLKLLFNLNYRELLTKIQKDSLSSVKVKKGKNKIRVKEANKKIEVVDRLWTQKDIDYWKQFGISTDTLNACNVYPIKQCFIVYDNGVRFNCGVSEYAYAYVEFKGGKQTIKVYQPFEKEHKWISGHDKSVISLWTKLPEKGEIICICSSLKDALTLWCNVGIPSIAPQGEGYKISKSAVKELKRRFTKIYILYDNDETGILKSKTLAKENDFIYLELPKINNCKDIAELRAAVGKDLFINILKNLFNYGT